MKKLFFFFGMFALLLLVGGAGCFSLTGNSGGTSGPAGVFVSQDRGANWVPISAVPTTGGVKNAIDASVYRLIGDPLDSHTLYWLSREQGLFFSYNDGREWHKVDGPLGNGFVYALAVHPKDKCTILATNGGQLYRTDDCGRSWAEIYRENRSDVHIASLLFNPFLPSQIFMAVSGGDLLESVDSGKSWKLLTRFPGSIVDIQADPLRKHVFYVAGRNDGLYRSDNDGADWLSLKETMKDFPGALENRRLLIHPQRAHELFWVSTYGIMVSRDDGESWRSLDLITPPGSVQIYGFAVNPNDDRQIYYTATINDRSTFYKSMDGGVHWVTSKLPSGQVPTALRVHPDQGNVVYLGFTIPPQQ